MYKWMMAFLYHWTCHYKQNITYFRYTILKYKWLHMTYPHANTNNSVLNKHILKFTRNYQHPQHTCRPCCTRGAAYWWRVQWKTTDRRDAPAIDEVTSLSQSVHLRDFIHTRFLFQLTKHVQLVYHTSSWRSRQDENLSIIHIIYFISQETLHSVCREWHIGRKAYSGWRLDMSKESYGHSRSLRIGFLLFVPQKRCRYT